MIKVQNNTATREPIPAFLHGLTPESLQDLSWTDPQLGVQDAAWWPEEDQSPALSERQRYGAETLTPDPARHVVVVTREVLAWSAEEIAADIKSRVPQSVTMRQARLALLGAGLLDDVEAAIAALPSPQKEAARIEWEYSQEVQRHNGFVSVLAPALGMTDEQTDALFVAAAAL